MRPNSASVARLERLRREGRRRRRHLDHALAGALPQDLDADVGPHQRPLGRDLDAPIEGHAHRAQRVEDGVDDARVGVRVGRLQHVSFASSDPGAGTKRSVASRSLVLGRGGDLREVAIGARPQAGLLVAADGVGQVAQRQRGVAGGGVVGRHQVVGIARGRLRAEIALEALRSPASSRPRKSSAAPRLTSLSAAVGVERLGAQEGLVGGVVADRDELERRQVEPALTLRGIELERAPQILLSRLELSEQEARGRAQEERARLLAAAQPLVEEDDRLRGLAGVDQLGGARQRVGGGLGGGGAAGARRRLRARLLRRWQRRRAVGTDRARRSGEEAGAHASFTGRWHLPQRPNGGLERRLALGVSLPDGAEQSAPY